MGSPMQQYLLDGTHSPKAPDTPAVVVDAADGDGEAMGGAGDKAPLPVVDEPEEPSRLGKTGFGGGYYVEL